MTGILLTIIYPMQELFSGNQNIYFLWGMADLLPNTFTADPLLNSPDPYPLFSWVISIFPARFLGIWTTILYVILNSVYSFSLFGIANEVADTYHHKSRLFSFAALFLFLHSSPVWGTYFNLISGIDLRWLWDSGIAEQGVLRGYLQPSVFGVFLLLSFYFATRKNLTTAILTIAPAAAIHANYLFLGGILTILYLIQTRFEKKTILVSVVLLVSVLPYSMYLSKNFLLLDEATKTAIDQAVLAGYESNIHINPSNWINPKFFIQLTVLILGIFVIWKTRFRNLFLGILAISILLTAISYLTGNTTLLSLNPWRLSILLIPISASVLTASSIASGTWTLIRPTLLIAASIIALATAYYRLFGIGIPEFLFNWKLAQVSLFLFGTVAFFFVSKRSEGMNRLLEPLLILALVLLGPTEMYMEYVTKRNLPQFQAVEKLKSPEPNAIYIVPSDWTSFRMNAQKAVFVDENLVYGPALPSLMNRLELVETNDYAKILSSIPAGTTIKLIAPNSPKIDGAISSESVTENYTCYVLRQ